MDTINVEKTTLYVVGLDYSIKLILRLKTITDFSIDEVLKAAAEQEVVLDETLSLPHLKDMGKFVITAESPERRGKITSTHFFESTN